MKKKEYESPYIKLYSLKIEDVLVTYSTEHSIGVQDKEEDETSEEEAPFGF